MAGKFLSSAKCKKFGLIIFFALLAIMTTLYFPNYARLKKMRQETKALDQENKQLETEIADYEDKIQKVKKTPYIYERIAREDLGAAKKGEVVIDIEQ